MNIQLIQELVLAHTGELPSKTPGEHLKRVRDFLACEGLREYLTYCLPREAYMASEVRVLPLQRIKDEMATGAAPGGFLAPFGYLVIASTIGGNAICVSKAGHVAWADHESFAEDYICYEDRGSGDYKYLYDYSAENVAKACVELSSDFETFLVELLSERLITTLEALD